MKIASRPVPYRAEQTALTGFLAWDEGRSDRRPGVFVAHGGGGLDDHARRQAIRLAELGYITFAGDLFGDGVAGDRGRVMARIGELRARRDVLTQLIRAGLRELSTHPAVDGRLAAVGYCFGGMSVLELARSGDEILGVASIHGSLSTDSRAAAGQIKSRILVCHGALDPHVPMAQVTGFVEEMTEAGADWQLAIYGGAMHGFTHQGPPSAIPGVAFHAPTDARSFSLLGQFLAEVLGPARAMG
jgi:dienelactone hydrolase